LIGALIAPFTVLHSFGKALFHVGDRDYKGLAPAPEKSGRISRIAELFFSPTNSID